MIVFSYLYGAVVALISAALLPLLVLFPRSRRRLGERFGRWRLPQLALESELLWFHGASLGEMNGLIPLMEDARRRFPKTKILATATSVTGIERAAPYSDFQRLLPIDSVFFLRKALGSLRFKAFVFGETELWPALIAYLRARGTPIFMVNARISDYSYGSYRLLTPLISRMLRPMRRIFASTPQAASRFSALGASDAQVVITGNSKFDKPPSVQSLAEADNFRAQYFPRKRPVLVLGSLRPGEEDVWFAALAEHRGLQIDVVIVPRHPERFDFFAEKLRAAEIGFKRISKGERFTQPGETGMHVVLADEVGKLEAVYSFADAAFIGGTLANFGGHNPLEAAAYGAAILLGPYTANVTELVDRLRVQGGVIELRTVTDAGRLLQQLARESTALREVGERAKAVWSSYRGSTERIMSGIEASLAAEVHA